LIMTYLQSPENSVHRLVHLVNPTYKELNLTKL
jgi:hypothetical protein